MKKKITVLLFEDGSFSLEYLLEQVNTLPEEYRNTINIEKEEVSYPYDSNTYYTINVTYEREETDEEYEKRKLDIKKRDSEFAARELEQLKKLQEKYKEFK